MAETPSSSTPPVPLQSLSGFMRPGWSGSILPVSTPPLSARGDCAADDFNPDAKLISCCADHAKYMAAVKDAPDEAEDGPAWRAYEDNRDAISAAMPQTLAGMVAKARAAKLEATFWDSSENIDGTMGQPWAWDLVNSLLRLAGER